MLFGLRHKSRKNGCQRHQTSAIDHLVSVCDISFFTGFASLFNSKNGKKKLRKYLFLIRIGLASALFMDWTTELLPSESVFGIYSCHDRLKPNTPIDLHVPKIKKSFSWIRFILIKTSQSRTEMEDLLLCRGVCKELADCEMRRCRCGVRSLLAIQFSGYTLLKAFQVKIFLNLIV